MSHLDIKLEMVNVIQFWKDLELRLLEAYLTGRHKR